MAAREHKSCPQGQQEPGVSPGDASAGRTADGRFAPGVCQNPRGRPRKRATDASNVLTRVLGEQIPGDVRGLSQQMTIEEGLVRFLCMNGFKEVGVALAVLKLAASQSRSLRADDQSPDDDEADQEALDRYVEREMRRRSRSERAGDDADSVEEEDPDNDEQGG